jgi:endonuclease I
MLLNVSFLQGFKYNAVNLFLKNNLNKCIYSRQILKEDNISLEHVIPKSYLPTKLQNDSQNLYPCHIIINKRRSNYYFQEEKQCSIERERVLKYGYSINSSLKMVYINDQAKGIVARMILYFYKTYNKRFDEILPLETAIRWNTSYPITDYEIAHDTIIKKIKIYK